MKYFFYKQTLYVFCALVLLVFIPQAFAQRYWNVAAKFEGNTNSYVAVDPYSSLKNLSGDFTVECWFYCEPGGRGTLFGKEGFRLLLDPTTGGNIRGRMQTNSNTKFYSRAAGMETNKWYHLACTYDQSGSGSMRFYINGVLDTSTTGMNYGPLAGTDSLFIGNSLYGSFKGMIDNIRVWNRALSGTEIAKNMRNPFVGALTTSPNFGSGLLMSCTFDFTYSGGGGGLYFYDGYNSYTNHGGSSVYIGNHPSETLAINSALDLTNGGYSVMPSNADIEFTGPVTAEAWIYPINPISGLSQYILKKSSNYAMYLDGTGNLRFIFSAVGSSTISIPPNKWTHIAITCSNSGIGYLYINGKYDIGFNFGSPPTPGTDSLFIGAYDHSSQFFNGYIDAVKISNYEKSQEQIQQSMFKIIDFSSRPSPPNSTVSIDFDYNNYSSTSNGGYYYLRGGAKYSSPAAFNYVPVSPIIGNNLYTFPNGYFYKSSDRRVPESNTAGYMKEDSIQITSSSSISDMKLYIALNHSRLTDLQIKLFAPTGDSVIVWDKQQGINSNVNDIVTVFDDNAEADLISYKYVDFGPTIKPLNSFLSAFGGKNPQGVWRLQITDFFNGSIGYLYAWGLNFNNVTGVDDKLTNEIPSSYNLFQNYPNPFNPTTKIRYSIPTAGSNNFQRVILKLYDILGNEIATLVNKEQAPGNYEVNVSSDKFRLASGVYIYKLSAGSFISSKKMILLK